VRLCGKGERKELEVEGDRAGVLHSDHTRVPTRPGSPLSDPPAPRPLAHRPSPPRSPLSLLDHFPLLCPGLSPSFLPSIPLLPPSLLPLPSPFSRTPRLTPPATDRRSSIPIPGSSVLERRSVRLGGRESGRGGGGGSNAGVRWE
jgi:hypothetical protein